jgi:hypothetical protein
MGVRYNTYFDMTGLEFYYDATNTKLYSGSGTSLIDLAGKNNGTLVNAPTYTSGNGGYFTFNGTNQEITTTTNYTGTGINSGPLTYVCWFRTSTSSGKKIIGFQNTQTGTSGTNFDKHVYVGTNGHLYLGIWNSGGEAISSGFSVANGIWRSFVAVINDGGTSSLYVDGILRNSFAKTSADTEAFVRICGYRLGTNWTNGTDGYYTGDIATIGMFRRAFKQVDVTAFHETFRGRFGI